MVELEYAVLFAATWWTEAVRGQRGVLLPIETIQWLGNRVDDFLIDPDTSCGDHVCTSFHWVKARMHDVVKAAAQYPGRVNTVSFANSSLPSCTFMWTARENGYFAGHLPAQQLVRYPGSRRLVSRDVRNRFGYRARLGRNS